mmetsp:Transcript_143214/g.399229  ORF Transcript_143214/g.399229 Transcript_143214/m.399229 type:complete len:454 (-) Transcript_143214:1899-3260(-)
MACLLLQIIGLCLKRGNDKGLSLQALIQLLGFPQRIAGLHALCRRLRQVLFQRGHIELVASPQEGNLDPFLLLLRKACDGGLAALAASLLLLFLFLLLLLLFLLLVLIKLDLVLGHLGIQLLLQLFLPFLFDFLQLFLRLQLLHFVVHLPGNHLALELLHPILGLLVEALLPDLLHDLLQHLQVVLLHGVFHGIHEWDLHLQLPHPVHEGVHRLARALQLQVLRTLQGPLDLHGFQALGNSLQLPQDRDLLLHPALHLLHRFQLHILHGHLFRLPQQLLHLLEPSLDLVHGLARCQGCVLAARGSVERVLFDPLVQLPEDFHGILHVLSHQTAFDHALDGDREGREGDLAGPLKRADGRGLGKDLRLAKHQAPLVYVPHKPGALKQHLPEGLRTLQILLRRRRRQDLCLQGPGYNHLVTAYEVLEGDPRSVARLPDPYGLEDAAGEELLHDEV